MRRVGARLKRHPVPLEQRRAVRMGDARANPLHVFFVFLVRRRRKQKKHEGAAYARVGLRRVVIRTALVIGGRVGEGRFHDFRPKASSMTGSVARRSFIVPTNWASTPSPRCEA